MYWYTTQEFTVKWGNSYSLSFSTANGIRQGGILSPYLYNLYTDDLSANLRDTGIGCHIHDGCINSLSYADDMVLLAPTADALQDLINVCQVYAAKHKIVYNTTKTECMTTKLLVVGNTLQKKFSYCSREVKMELFRSHCYSIYCNSLGSRYKVATITRLKVCHNDILKRLLRLPRWCSSSLAFARNGVNNLDVIRRHSVFSLRSRVELSTNSIITSVRQSSAYVCGPIQQRWLGLLFVQNVG
ncbi:hypothetical protein GWK47_017775 [Chionoecetes opilio]|uniref:Reverse transcriptase domain-containing protein n=1 Tax=Chionoecetes opilio TaxID=41210 RepID=A0A8J4XTK2_CHIOP|nr:hypothetical protein GWK47_017775 [Chionoecetes opilio]